MKLDWKPALKMENALAPIIEEMTDNGWLLDQPLCHELIGELTEVIDTESAKVVPLVPPTPKQHGQPVKPFKKDGGLTSLVTKWYADSDHEVVGPFIKIQWDEFNIGSDKQVKAYLQSIGWKPTEWNYKKGVWPREKTSPKLTEDSLENLKHPAGKIIAHVLKCRHRRSLLEGLLKIVREDGRVGQRVTGMTPTYRCTHAGIVNIPGEDAFFGPECRSVFTSRPGYKIVGVDSMSCQLRMLCHYMKDPKYTEAVINGKKEDGTDIHTLNMNATGGMITNRTDAKRFIYALLFGGGDGKLGSILGGNSDDGARLRAKFLKSLPALDKLLKGLKKRQKAKGFFIGLDGRPIHVRKEHMLLVYALQSAEAIYMKYTLLFLHKWATKKGIDFKIVVFMHDEIQAEVREDHVKQYVRLAKKAFIKAGEYLNLNVPMAGDPAVGNNWKETH